MPTPSALPSKPTVAPSPLPAVDTATPLPSATPTIVPEPSLQLSPAVGEPGTLMTVVGNDWQAGDTVFIYLQDPTLATSMPTDYGLVMIAASVDNEGHFIAAFVFPSDTRWRNLSDVLLTAHSPATDDAVQTAYHIFVPVETPKPTSTGTATPLNTSLSKAPDGSLGVIVGVLLFGIFAGVVLALLILRRQHD